MKRIKNFDRSPHISLFLSPRILLFVEDEGIICKAKREPIRVIPHHHSSSPSTIIRRSQSSTITPLLENQLPKSDEKLYFRKFRLLIKHCTNWKKSYFLQQAIVNNATTNRLLSCLLLYLKNGSCQFCKSNAVVSWPQLYMVYLLCCNHFRKIGLQHSRWSPLLLLPK